LRQASELLRQPHQLGAEAQEALADIVAELEQLLQTGMVPAEELAHLRDSTTHLVRALREHHDEGLLASARASLTQTVAAAEAKAPFTTGILRRALDALANIGI
jgi:hypothetical protein